jgi:hypothetical protein
VRAGGAPGGTSGACRAAPVGAVASGRAEKSGLWSCKARGKLRTSTLTETP